VVLCALTFLGRDNQIDALIDGELLDRALGYPRLISDAEWCEPMHTRVARRG
jgi:hypothetical protein